MGIEYKTKGFTLIELICSMLIISVLIALSGVFIATGVKGFFLNYQTSGSALKARSVMNRIRLELREIDDIKEFIGNSRIKYESDSSLLPGNNRTLKYVSGKIYIHEDPSDAATLYTLLDDVDSFSLTMQKDDLDNDSNVDDVVCLKVEFILTDISAPFVIRVYPRNRIQYP